jgi:hypothetical protein
VKIKCSLAPSSIDSAIKQLEEYKRSLEEKADELARRLADFGYAVSYGYLSLHVFDGNTAASLDVIEDGPGRYVLYAASEAILFLEFGTGLKGGGNPKGDELGYGPGTYPGKGHWNDPKGWWFETSDPRLIVHTSKKTGKSYGHSYGMSAVMPMYNASKDMRSEILNIAREVFKA